MLLQKARCHYADNFHLRITDEIHDPLTTTGEDSIESFKQCADDIVHAHFNLTETKKAAELRLSTNTSNQH